MINEYMFLSGEHKDEVKSLKFDGVFFEFNDIKGTDLWTIRCSAEGANESSAKKLSDVHSNIIRFSPKVLTCESSQYFNNSLYPLINQFERKLRKLVYLADAISGNEKNNIGELEKKDFGEIFDMLFIDENFINTLKSRVNAGKGSVYEGKSRYAKSEILDFLNATTENTLWDIIFDIDDVPTLKRRFRDIQTYRNYIMHAHNIDKKSYGKIKYLFNKVNGEIDKAIGRRMNDSKKECITPGINIAISSALQRFADISANIRSGLESLETITATLDGLLHPSFIDYINTANIITQNSGLMEIVNSPIFVEHLAQMERINSITQQPGFRTAEELSYKLSALEQQAIKLETVGNRLINKANDTSVGDDNSTEDDSPNDKKKC
ncbi:MAG: hypothetical protein NC299_15725 [Lachnospiraceae bacterium]|nr:hypothetical protein [Ruminococcus sp.]MCM1276783.1 hypothetical protein [Lachnospiraceae bacterium]